jgi:hypothetical protein
MKKIFCTIIFFAIPAICSHSPLQKTSSGNLMRTRRLTPEEISAMRKSQPGDIPVRRSSSSEFNQLFLHEEALVVDKEALKPNPGVKKLDPTNGKKS